MNYTRLHKVKDTLYIIDTKNKKHDTNDRVFILALRYIPLTFKKYL